MLCVSLAVLIFIKSRAPSPDSGDDSEEDELDEDTKELVAWPLFHGSSQKARMSKLLIRVLDGITNPIDLAYLSAPPSEIGLHSPRKGANTFVHGFVSGPGHIAVCHRGQWTLGDTQDRYNFFTDGADQFC